jgi:hypothetical protein
MKISKQYRHFVSARGIQLRSLGIYETALERTDALAAIEFLRSDMIPILGGDVYLRRDAKIEPAYANWHSDREDRESNEEYLTRSWASTEAYIRRYPEPPNGTPLFVLVLGE